MHLDYHASRYGKMAISFHRRAAIRHGFSPVLYQLTNSASLQALCDGMDLIEDVNPVYMPDSVHVVCKLLRERTIDAESKVDDDYDYSESYECEKATAALRDLRIMQEVMDDGMRIARTILAFIRTFKTHEFSTIYCEREWRSTKPFAFGYGDLAMVVLPKRIRSGPSFEDRVAQVRALPGFPDVVPIVAWEDLVEH